MSKKLPKFFLKRRRAKPFWFGEPWVFDGSIDREKTGTRISNGDIVEVCDFEGKRIGEGFYSSESQIRIRLVSWGAAATDDNLIVERLERAIRLRVSDSNIPQQSNAYRLVHSEGDGLPGLIVDRMNDCLVVQFDTAGMRKFRELVVATLSRILVPTCIFERVSKAAIQEEGLDSESQLLFGEEPQEVQITEHGIRYLVDFQRGQKTGYYCDQRDNRLTLAHWAKGRRALDAFCYTGSFAFNMLKHGGAEHVTGVDSSQPAIDCAHRNATLNGLEERFETERGNVLRILDHWSKEGRRFDLVFMDPPKFVPKKGDLRKGLKLYLETNMKGLRVLEPGGIFASCSCSSAVSEEDFSQMIARAAEDVGLSLQRLHRGTQGADHPVLLPHEESEYLKFQVYRAHARTSFGQQSN